MKLAAWITAAATAIAGALLPGCDSVNLPSIKPGVTSAAEVRQRLGAPGFEFTDEDGRLTWEYSRQPAGTVCYMIRFGPDRIVARVDQVLDDAHFAMVRNGMTRDDIRRLLGKPASTAVFDNLGEEVWEWHIAGDNPLDDTRFDVSFDRSTGQVKRAGQRIEQRNG